MDYLLFIHCIQCSLVQSIIYIIHSQLKCIEINKAATQLNPDNFSVEKHGEKKTGNKP